MQLTDEQMVRLKRIWATDLEGCQRAQQYRILGVQRSPRHFASIRGSALHSIHENMLKGAENPLDVHIPEFHDEVMDSLTDEIDMLNKWRATTKLDMSKAEAEVKFELDLGRGYSMVRKIDVLTPTTIIDLKSGSFNGRVSKAVKAELAMSHEAVERAGEGRRDCYVVYLGGAEPKEIKVFGGVGEIADAVIEAYAKVEEVISARERMAQGENMRIEPSQLCSYCDYRGSCRGI